MYGTQRNANLGTGGRFRLQSWLNALVGVNSRPRYRGRARDLAATDIHASLDGLCGQLLNLHDDAAGAAVAREVIALYELLDDAGKIRLLGRLARHLRADLDKAKAAAESFIANPGQATLATLSRSTSTLGQVFLSRMNQAPSGTMALVRMRADLLALKARIEDADMLDHIFADMFRIWFNSGFLDLSRIGWSNSADTLEKIIRYEAVHAIDGWNDLRSRVQPPDRLMFGFFHHRLGDEPLIFVEIALTRGMPAGISGILSESGASIDPRTADTAVFYSISNCHEGLRGVPLGNLLIKRVVDELRQSFPQLASFVTLSPVPGFAQWLSDRISDGEITLPPGWDSLDDIREEVRKVGQTGLRGEGQASAEALLSREVARYLVSAKDEKGRICDPVGRFHLGNGARLERVNFGADTSGKGLAHGLGMMVNYEYSPDEIEANCSRLAETGEVAVSDAITKLLDRPLSGMVAGTVAGRGTRKRKRATANTA